MTGGRTGSPPGPADLQRLLAYLSIRPSTGVEALARLLERAPAVDLTSHLMAKIDQKRHNLAETRDLRQIGLFDFYLGLIFLSFDRNTEAAPCFERARSQWSLYQERPHVCLARFATGAAYHHHMDFTRASTIYAEVAAEADRIRDELSGGFYSEQVEYQQTFADYRGFIDDLTGLLESAQASLGTDDLVGAGTRSVPQPRVSLDSDEHPLVDLRPYHLDGIGLQRLMDSSFSDQEIREICLILGVDYSRLAGSDKRSKIRELISRLEEPDRIPELIEELKRWRPQVGWAATIQYVSQEAATERFIAPLPTPVTIGRKEWFQVVRKAEPFLDDIEVGDWLYAPSEGVAEGDIAGQVIVAGLASGSIEVRSEDDPFGPPLYLAKFIRNTATGEVRVITTADNRPVTLGPQQIRGNVVRRCKNN
jgi:hypothetical protein